MLYGIEIGFGILIGLFLAFLFIRLLIFLFKVLKFILSGFNNFD